MLMSDSLRVLRVAWHARDESQDESWPRRESVSRARRESLGACNSWWLCTQETGRNFLQMSRRRPEFICCVAFILGCTGLPRPLQRAAPSSSATSQSAETAGPENRQPYYCQPHNKSPAHSHNSARTPRPASGARGSRRPPPPLVVCRKYGAPLV